MIIIIINITSRRLIIFVVMKTSGSKKYEVSGQLQKGKLSDLLHVT
jgi:hypothetical protein